MQTVEPIRNMNDLKKIKKILMQDSDRNLLLFNLGINTGLRISDILNLKVGDIKEKEYITIKEQKTNKVRKILISTNIKSILGDYIQGKKANEYLFSSRKGENKPITRIQAWRIIRYACQKAKINSYIGTHTLRKTFGYHFYKQTKDIAMLQSILNHSSPSVTLRYIGINQEIMDNKLRNFCL